MLEIAIAHVVPLGTCALSPLPCSLRGSAVAANTTNGTIATASITKAHLQPNRFAI